MTRLFLALSLVALAIILGPSLHRELVGTSLNADFITGLATGIALLSAGAILWILARGRYRRRALPASTVRQCAIARRRCRADLSLVSAGHDRRNWIPVSTDQFDNEPTHPHTKGDRQ